MSFTTAIMQSQDASAMLEKLEKLTSSFAILALAMKQSSDEFKAAALQFSTAMDAVRAAPAFVPSPPIDTATPAAAKAATALAATALPPPPIDTATPAAQKTAEAIALEERDAHYDAMEARHLEYVEHLEHIYNFELSMKRERMEEYHNGCIRVIGGRRVLIYKYHAFEMPTDRPYNQPGPLISIGAIDPDSKAIRPLLAPPELPTTASTWHWGH